MNKYEIEADIAYFESCIDEIEKTHNGNIAEFMISRQLCERVISALEKQMNSGWIPIKTRPLTEEEKKEYAGYNYTDAYDCKMPDNEQEVLITTNYGTVEKTTYYTDYGCYFDGWEDDGEVIAWMPLPKPYN